MDPHLGANSTTTRLCEANSGASTLSRGTAATVTRDGDDNNNNRFALEGDALPKRTKSITSAKYWDDLIGLALGVRATPYTPPTRSSTVSSSTSTLHRTSSNFSSISRASSKTSLASTVVSPRKLPFRKRKSVAELGRTSQSPASDSVATPDSTDEMRFFNRSKQDDRTVLRAVPETEASGDYFSSMAPSDKTTQSFVSPITMDEYNMSVQTAYQRSKTQRRQQRQKLKDAELVGYWKDGKVHWVTQELSESSSSDEAPTPPLSLPYQPGQGLAAARQAKRPGIKLQIPAGIYTNPIPDPVPFASQQNTQNARSPQRRTTTKSQLSPKQRGEIRSMLSRLSVADRPQHPLESRHHPKNMDSDVSSIYSSRTNVTSIQNKRLHPHVAKHMARPSVFSVRDPIAAGVFDDGESVYGAPESVYGPPDYSESVIQHLDSKAILDDARSTSGYSVQDPVAHGVFDGASRAGSVYSQMSYSATTRSAVRKANSTTLENKRLRKHMSAARKVFEQQLPSVPDVPSISPGIEPPAIPERSRKREWKTNPTETSNLNQPWTRPALQRVFSDPSLDQDLPRPQVLRRQKTDTDNFYAIRPRPLSLPVSKRMAKAITPNAAQTVILNILENLDSFKDLASASCLNNGFRSVFRRFELRLIKKVLWNRSTAAWELRESSPKEIITSLINNPASDYSPTRYMQFHTRDCYIIQALKSLILVRCQSYLRPDTIMALRIPETPKAAEIDDALWRIWTFCTIFGSGKAREDDIQGQIDWIRGGSAAHATQTVKSDAVDSNSILINPPPYFAKGNGTGLSAEQIYDMTEMWNCISSLLSGIQGAGRIQQARRHGVFNGQRLEKDDLDEEEKVLQEWGYYIATLGLSAVCDLAQPAMSRDESVFVVAEDMGWTQWHRPLHGGSRGNFLREALSTVYAERMSASGAGKSAVSTEERRQRHLELAIQLQETKKTTEYANVPISEERPMSMWMYWERQASKYSGTTPIELLQAAQYYGSDESIERAPTPPPKDMSSPVLHKELTRKTSHSSLSLFPPQYKSHTPSITSTVIPLRKASQSTPELLSHDDSDCSNSPVQRFSRSPSNSDSSQSTAASSIHSQQEGDAVRPQTSYSELQRGIVGESSVDRKVFRLVEMGFAIEDAKKALAKADDGSVLREEIAIERLLRGKF